MFNKLRELFPNTIDVYRGCGRLTLEIFHAFGLEPSFWDKEIVPCIRNENRDELTATIRRWALASDQVYYSEAYMRPETEAGGMWESLVNRLDRRLDREWRAEM